MIDSHADCWAHDTRTLTRIVRSMGAEFLSVAEGGLCGEALYCAVILWLSVMSWIIFTFVDDDAGGDGRRRRRRHQGSPVFVGAVGLCDGTGPRCSGGYGPCGTCLD